ncbi:hypothetical protein [Sphingomonas sp. IW22]|uniref:hypothetical protein n=1 Tax=Sphingomonas sp. IW22 TaxID=3242489 RepID=UPI003521F025
MLNLLSILIGLLSLPLIILGWIPLLGWSLWFVLTIPVVGTAVGALSNSNTGRNFNLVLIVLGAIRLFLGGGLI